MNSPSEVIAGPIREEAAAKAHTLENTARNLANNRGFTRKRSTLEDVVDFLNQQFAFETHEMDLLTFARKARNKLQHCEYAKLQQVLYEAGYDFSPITEPECNYIANWQACFGVYQYASDLFERATHVLQQHF